jgi:hypothetical protein
MIRSMISIAVKIHETRPERAKHGGGVRAVPHSVGDA